MSAWISVYCTHSLAQVTPAALDAALAQVDFWTLAEIYAIDEAHIKPALACLKYEIARFLAALGGGLLRDMNDSWWRVGKEGEFVKIVT